MAHHNFNFEHGDILSHLGATWYASYAYHRHCDTTHNNYTLVDTWRNRKSTYERHLELEKYFTEKIAEMNPQRLATNAIELTGLEVLRMARAVLAKMNKSF
ncbi:MAG TPA: hypothetical protein VN369_08155 [Terriglobales bacterium]|nr:hypothetical protein [Terriglobales bacterium]